MESKNTDDDLSNRKRCDVELQNGQTDGEREEKGEAKRADAVHFLSNQRLFDRRTFRVHRRTRFDARLDDKTDDAATCDGATVPNRVVDIDALLERARTEKGAMERVDVFVRGFAFDVELGCRDFVSVEFEGGFCGVAELPVGFAIELVGSDEARSRVFRSVEQNEICGNALVAFDAEESADGDFRRENLFEGAVGLQLLVLGVVDAAILDPALHFVKKVLRHGEDKNEDERGKVSEERANAELANHLRQGEKKEVDVVDAETELVE